MSPPAMLLQVDPPSVDCCHCSVGGGKPLAAAGANVTRLAARCHLALRVLGGDGRRCHRRVEHRVTEALLVPAQRRRRASCRE